MEVKEICVYEEMRKFKTESDFLHKFIFELAGLDIDADFITF